MRVAAGRVIAESADAVEVLDVPTDHVARIVCFGSVGLSAGTRAWAMSNDVDVAFISPRELSRITSTGIVGHPRRPRARPVGFRR